MGPADSFGALLPTGLLSEEVPGQGLVHRLGAAKGHCINRASFQCGLWGDCHFTSWPGLPAKCPPASGTAQQVQLRILTTAAVVPRISSRLGRPWSVLPVTLAGTSAGGDVGGGGTPPLFQNPNHFTVALGPREWAWASSTCVDSACEAQNGTNDKNHNDRRIH